MLINVLFGIYRLLSLLVSVLFVHPNPVAWAIIGPWVASWSLWMIGLVKHWRNGGKGEFLKLDADRCTMLQYYMLYSYKHGPRFGLVLTLPLWPLVGPWILRDTTRCLFLPPQPETDPLATEAGLAAPTA